MNIVSLDKSELLAVLQAAREHSELDWLMFCIQYIHAMRISEVLDLTAANIDAAGFLTVQRLKGSLKTVQPLVTHSDPLLNEAPSLLARLQTIKPGQRLFDEGLILTKHNAAYRFAKYARLAGLPKHKQHNHCLRHSRASHTIKQAGIENVRQLLGHASLASTGAYLRVSDDSAWAALGAAAGL